MTAAGPPVTARGRILGVDAARALALVGMFATHLLPLGAGDAPTWTGLIADGRSSALFAVLAGVGVALSTREVRAARGTRGTVGLRATGVARAGDARGTGSGGAAGNGPAAGGVRAPSAGRAHLGAAAGLLVRGAMVGLLGLALADLDPPVAVILAYYALLFAVAAPLLRLPTAALAAGAVLAGALAPVLSMVARAGGPTGPGDQPGIAALAEPGPLFETLALTGYYPVLTWTTYLLAGMAVGRLDLRRHVVAVRLLAGGAALAVSAAAVSALLLGPGGGAAALGVTELRRRAYGTTPTEPWWWLAVDAPHTGTPLDLAHTTGTALAVLGAMLLLARWSRAAVWVPAAVGAAPLTLYTAHVVAVTAYAGDGTDETSVWLANVAGAVAVGTALALCGRRGPLESAVSAAGRAVRASVGAHRERHGEPDAGEPDADAQHGGREAARHRGAGPGAAEQPDRER